MADSLSVGEALTMGLYTPGATIDFSVTESISVSSRISVFFRPSFYRLSPTPTADGRAPDQLGSTKQMGITGEVSITV